MIPCYLCGDAISVACPIVFALLLLLSYVGAVNAIHPTSSKVRNPGDTAIAFAWDAENKVSSDCACSRMGSTGTRRAGPRATALYPRQQLTQVQRLHPGSREDLNGFLIDSLTRGVGSAV